MSLQETCVLSYGLAAAAFAALAILLGTAWRGRLQGAVLVLAAVFSSLWGLVSAMFCYMPEATDWLPSLMNAAEAIRDLLWIAFFALLVFGKDEWRERALRRPLALTGVVALLFAAIVLTVDYGDRASWAASAHSLALFGAMAFAIVGLVLVEQVYRKAPGSTRRDIKTLCYGVGAIFAYDFVLYSEALLYSHVDQGFWDARGVINAMVVPLIAVSAARNPKWSVDIHVSRSVVYHSTTFIGAGIYLMVMAAGGYYIRYLGGSWGGFAQTVFISAAALFLTMLLLSERARAKAKVFISKHFYSFRYDYRGEWLGFTRALDSQDDAVSLSERVLRALANTVDCDGGALWVNDGGGTYVLRRSVDVVCDDALDDITANDPLIEFFERTEWVMDLNELVDEPERYDGLAVPEYMLMNRWAWLLIPLFHHGSLLAIVAIKQPKSPHRIDWEDRDVIKTAGMQAATYLAQAEAARALVDARQFEAFNQLSAFIIHDLKNLVSQLSMLVQNAKRHGDDPEFVKDMIATVDNSVDQMNALLHKLKSGWKKGDESSLVKLSEIAREAVNMKSGQRPQPQLAILEEGLEVNVDRQRLVMVLSHIIQNAQDATHDEGEIHVDLRREHRFAVIEISDTGAGMDSAFIRDRLFRPFASTKGRGNMGIGVFEARQFLRQQDGDITVKSRLGEGSCFTLRIPLAQDNEPPK
ncbi:MAG: PEP-CTERM system histidine kinase PrsK [Gammaproteobacteria bacterium]|nr:PEP-CTERM system histidine kinase PrsK [Gammaproteobacteria bacterium]